MVTPIQGDVYWVQFGSPKDSGPAGKRPVVVIQNDLLNRSNSRIDYFQFKTGGRTRQCEFKKGNREFAETKCGGRQPNSNH